MTRSTWKTALLPSALMSMAAGAACAEDAAVKMQLAPPDQRLSIGGVLANAAIPVKLIMAGLMIAIAASVVLWLLKFARKAPAGGFLSAVVVSGPLFGVAAAAFTLLTMAVGVANVRPSPDLATLAPGLAEAALTVLLGMLAGAVAAAARGHLQSRAEVGLGNL
jgi:hypothetical protein